MAKAKGSEKSGGRTKDSPNKLTKAAREIFVETLEGQVPRIESAFDEVYQKDKSKYLELFCKYAQYFVPKQLDLGIDKVSIEIIRE